MSQPTQREAHGAGSSEPMDAVVDEAPNETQLRTDAGDAEPTWQFLKQGYDWTGGSLRTKGYRTDFDSVRIPTSPAHLPSPQAPMRPVDRKLDWRHPDHLGLVAEFVSSLNPPAPRAAAAAVQIPNPIPTPTRTGWRWLGWGLAAGGLLALAAVSLREGGNTAVQTAPMIAAVSPASLAPPEPIRDSSEPSDVAALAPPENTVPQPPAEAAADAATAVVASPDSGSAPTVPAASSRIELEVSEILVSSRAVAAVVILKRTGSTTGPVRVRWKTVPGTATPGTDYESVSAIVKFADGQAMRTLFVPILQPPERTEPRSFSIELRRLGKGAKLGSIKRTTVTIWGDT